VIQDPVLAEAPRDERLRENEPHDRSAPKAIRILLPVWGDAFVGQFLDHSLPTLLAPGNIPALAQTLPTRFVFLSRARDEAAIRAHPAGRHLAQVSEVEFAPIDDLIASGNHSTTITLAFARGVRAAGPEMLDTCFFFLVADYIMADGSLAAVLAHMQEGASAVQVGNFQVDEATAERWLQERLAGAGTSLALTPREVMRWALGCMHPLTAANIVNFPLCHNLEANRLLWRVDADTLIGRFYLLHMICIRPEVTDFVVGSSCDYSFVPEMCPSANVVTIADSDDYLVVEVQPTGHESRVRPLRAWWRTTILALLAVGAAAAVYWPLLRVYFFADDFVCLLAIEDQGFARFVLQVFGGHILLVRNLVFYLSAALFGFRPEPYYATALLMHLVNVWLLFRVVHAFTDDAALAALGATAWGTSPLCVGTLGWYAVFGHVLATTIMLVVLGALARRASSGTIPARTVAGWAVLLLAGTTCFGVGIGVAIAFPLAVVLLAPGALRDRRVLAIVLGLAPAVVAFYFGYRWISALVEPLSLIEAVVLRTGMRNFGTIVTMVGHTLAFATSGIILGFLFVPAGYPGTQSHLAVAGAVLAVAVLCVIDGEARRRCLALLALSAGALGIIALGRANFYEAIHFSPQTLANQLRYYYAALAPLAVIGCLVLDRARRAVRVPGSAVLAAWLALAGWGFARSSWHVDERDLFRAYTQGQLRLIDAAIDREPAGADVRIPNQRAAPILLGPILRPVDFPGWVGFFVLRYPENVVRGRRMLFVESDAALLGALRVPEKHHRLHDLLVPP